MALSDRTLTLLGGIQGLMEDHGVAVIEAEGIKGANTFAILFDDPANNMRLVLIRKDQIFDPSSSSGTLELNPAQQAFISALQGYMNANGVLAIQSLAVSKPNQGMAFLLDAGNAKDAAEVAVLTTNDYTVLPSLYGADA